MKLRMGKAELELGSSYLGELRDSNDIREDLPALRARLEEDGYLLIRGLYDREPVVAARRFLLERLAGEGQIAPETNPDDAIMAPGAKGAFWGGKKEVTHAEPVRSLLEGEPVMAFFSRLLEGPVLTYDYKWVRVVGPEQFTGAHYDIVYMGRGTPNLYTCWTPLSDIDYADSPLAVCVGSHRFERVRETYGRMDVDRDRVDGWFTTDPVEIVDRFGGQWQTTTFRMGDALVFGMFTMHASFNNESSRFRMSADTRYQLASEPVDERWVGETPKAHYAWQSEPEKVVSMEEARAKWGI